VTTHQMSKKLFAVIIGLVNVNVNVRVFSAPPTQTGPARHYNSLNMNRIGSVG